MKISVLIPSFRRPLDLDRCLKGLSFQNRMPDEIVLVHREDDNATLEVANLWIPKLPMKLVLIKVTGLVQALNAGVAASSSEIIAMTDDDTYPHADWLEKIESYFSNDERIGGVGGRDWLQGRDGPLGIPTTGRVVVGKITWFGKPIGNHHCGFGPACEVDILKGANCAFRKALLEKHNYDVRLRGAGAQWHNEVGVCLGIKRDGFKLIYDPQILVDHFASDRFDSDIRESPSPKNIEDRTYNYDISILDHLNFLGRYAFLIWEAHMLVINSLKNTIRRKKVFLILLATIRGMVQSRKDSKS